LNEEGIKKRRNYMKRTKKVENSYKNQLEIIKSLIINKNENGIIIDGKKTYGKYVNSIGGYIYEINLVPVILYKKKYNFIELKGVDAFEEEINEKKTYICKYYLLNKDRYIWKEDESKMLGLEKKSEDYYVNYVKKRLPGAKESSIYFYNFVFDKENRNRASCIELLKIKNNEKNEVDVQNIGSTNHCNLPQNDKISGLTGIFLLIFSLLKKVRFDGILTIGDQAKKDGKRVAFYYMKKYNEPEYLINNGDYMKFSKYQDFGFTLNPKKSEPLLKLLYIKAQARTLDINNYEELEKEFGKMMGDLFHDCNLTNFNYKKTLEKMLKEI